MLLRLFSVRITFWVRTVRFYHLFIFLFVSADGAPVPNAFFARFTRTHRHTCSTSKAISISMRSELGTAHLLARARLVVWIATVNECDCNHYNAESSKVTFNSGCVRLLWTRCLRWGTAFHILVAAIRWRAIHNAIFVEMAPNAKTVILRIASHHFGTRRTFCEMTKLHFCFVQFAAVHVNGMQKMCQNLLSYAVKTISNSRERWLAVSGCDLSMKIWIFTLPSSSLKNAWRPSSVFASNVPQIFCNFAWPNEMRT